MSSLQTLILNDLTSISVPLEIDDEISLPFHNTLQELDIAGTCCSQEVNYLSHFVTRILSLKSLKINICTDVPLDDKFSYLNNLQSITIDIQEWAGNFIPNEMFTPIKWVIREINIHSNQNLWSYGEIYPIATGNQTFKFLPSLKVSIGKL